MQPTRRELGEANQNGAAASSDKEHCRRLAKDGSAEWIGHDETAIAWNKLEREAVWHREVKAITKVAIFRPFAITAEIRYRRFDFDDDKLAIPPERQDVGAPPISKRYLDEGGKAAMSKCATDAAGKLSGKIASV